MLCKYMANFLYLQKNALFYLQKNKKYNIFASILSKNTNLKESL